MKNYPSPHLSVLVVEDDAFMQMLMPKLFEPYDLPVYVADNGAHAIHMLKKIETEKLVIILDLSMPVMNGFEFLNSWGLEQENFDSSNTMIYIHSTCANTEVNSLKRKYEKSVKGSISKPATCEMIHTIIEPLLAMKYAS